MHVKSISPEATWDIRHKVLWPDQPFEFVKIPNDAEGLHFGCFMDKKLVSIISAFISIDLQEAQFRKFATLKEEQGKGYGSQLLSHLLLDLTQQGIKKIWCNARLDKAKFYEGFGLTKTDQHFFKKGIEYVVMEKLI